MARFLIDEDLPRSLARRLSEAGHDAEDVRDVGLRGESDKKVFNHAVKSGRALISGDLGFSKILDFPLGSHAGVVVVRIPNDVPAARVVELVVRAAGSQPSADFRGNLMIVEPDRIRLRRTRPRPVQ